MKIKIKNYQFKFFLIEQNWGLIQNFDSTVSSCNNGHQLIFYDCESEGHQEKPNWVANIYIFVRLGHSGQRKFKNCDSEILSSSSRCRLAIGKYELHLEAIKSKNITLFPVICHRFGSDRCRFCCCCCFNVLYVL